MTDNRTTDLLPCPFCGGEAVFMCGFDGKTTIECINCRVLMDNSIAAWNARAERTCRNENGEDKYANFICSECGLHIHKPNIGRSYVDEDGKRWYGTSNEHGLNYCPNCGAKVVGK